MPRPFLLLLPLLLLAAPAAHAQITNNSTKPGNIEFMNRQLALGKGVVPEAVRGSPFVLPRWAPGRLLMLSGATKDAELKFDLADNRLLWRRPAGDSLELFTEQIREFAFGDSVRDGGHFVFRRYLDARIENYRLRTLFFEVCYDGGRHALLRQRARVVSEPGASGGLTRRRLASWRETSAYFVRRPDNVIEPVRLNARAVLAALGPIHAEALTAYAAAQQLQLSGEADVVRLLRYADTLP